MFGLLDQLRTRQKPIRIGIAGIGSIGTGMVLQANLTPGMECVAIADLKLDRAIAAAEGFQLDYEVVTTANGMHDAIQRGKLAVTDDAELVARLELLDVFVEATSSIVGGALYGRAALETGTHLVMMNYEADLMFGPLLMQQADSRGLVYTVADGDQPAVLRRLIAEMEFMGFDLVMAGNIKGFLDRYTNPTRIIPEADKRGLDYKMCSSYTDGTKLAVEMSVLANGMGLRTDVPGMHGPRMRSIYEVFENYDFESIWRDRHGVVDYVLGATPKGGVFAVGYTDIPYQQDTLAWFPPDMGPGPFYLFYRPYHLGHFESMATVAEAVVNGRSVLRPDYGFQTNVYAYARRAIKAGESLDGIGGYAAYGAIENCCDNQDKPGLPICLAENVTVKRDIPKDDKICMDDVRFAEDDVALQLHREAMAVAGGSAVLCGSTESQP